MINKDNIEENDTYIFDRGYISSEWWSIINNSKAFFNCIFFCWST